MTSAMLIVFIVTLVLGFPIALVMGLSCLIPNLVDPTFSANLQFVVRGIVGGANTLPILAVPLFILSGDIMAKGGISEKLFNVFAYAIGKIPGGMPCASVITCLFYGAISGSGPATCAAVGGMAIPVLTELGYDKKFSAALVGTAGGLGIIIPPSIPFVVYGLATGASVGQMFVAGIIPGFIIAFCLMGYAIYSCVRHGEDKEKINKHCDALRSKGFWALFVDSIWALLAPVIILGGIFSGIFTPTEAACVSVFYALIVSLFVYKTIKIKDIWNIFASSVSSYAPLCLILALATVLGRVFTLLGVPTMLAEFITTYFSSKIAFLLAINVAMLIMGMFIDTVPALMILSPMLLPVAKLMGINEIHFGIILVVNLAIGFITPPFGLNLFVASKLVDEPVMAIGKRVIPFVGAFIIALLLITYIPALSLAML